MLVTKAAACPSAAQRARVRLDRQLEDVGWSAQGVERNRREQRFDRSPIQTANNGMKTRTAVTLTCQ